MTMGRWFSRRCLFSLYGHAVNTSCCLSVPSLVRWFVRSLACWYDRSFALFLLRATLSFLVRFVQVGARRGIQAVIRFVRARTPAFPIDRSNGTLPHPRFNIEFSPVCTLSLASFTFSCTSSSSCSSPFRLRWSPLVLLIIRALCVSDRRCVFFHALLYPFIFRFPPFKISNISIFITSSKVFYL